MYVGDWVLRAIDAEIGRCPPERGGALLGPPQRPLISRFLPDPEAVSTPSSYSPSRALDRSVKEHETRDRLELKGLVHSHPRFLDRPSGQDAYELGVGLGLNGHIPFYVAPIVTGWADAAKPPSSSGTSSGASDAAADLAPHELALGETKISFYAAYRTRSGAAQVLPLRVRAIPMLRDLESVARELGAGTPEVFVSDMGTGAVLAGRMSLQAGCKGGGELLLLASELYPALPPVLLLTLDGGATEQLEIPWRLETPAEARLLEATRAVFVPPGPYRRAFGPRGGPALTRDLRRARLAGWQARFTGEDAEGAASGVRDALFARSAGILSQDLRDRCAMIAGCGSVGSYMASQLARSGVGRMTLLDPERVEAANLSRSAYEAQDVGHPKTEALARRLLRIDPALNLTLHRERLDALEAVTLDVMVRAADVVVAATDDPAAQRALNRFAYAREKPALFVGLYAGAQGGEVLVTVPGRTPCYLCATRTRHQAERAVGRVASDVDYGSGRLQGELALGADIQHVASAAVKLALALLVPAGARLKGFADDVLAAGTSYLTMSMVPRYWFYPRIFGDVPGQGAYQSVWLTPTRSEECPVCGSPEHRVEPLEVPLRAPRLAAFLARASDSP